MKFKFEIGDEVMYELNYTFAHYTIKEVRGKTLVLRNTTYESLLVPAKEVVPTQATWQKATVIN